MGFLRKLTGTQGQIDATHRNADVQVAALEQSARDATAQAQASAQAAANQQKMLVERAAAERAAAEAVGQPVEQAEVRLGPTEGSLANRSKARRAKFGQSSTTGVRV